MKKNVAITIISILAVATIALGILYFTNDADKTKQIDGLLADVSDRDSQIQSLSADIKDKEGQIDALNADVADKTGQIKTLSADVADKAGQIETLNADVAQKDGKIEKLDADVEDKASQIKRIERETSELKGSIKEKDAQIEDLTGSIIEKDNKINELSGTVLFSEGRIAALEKELESRAGEINGLKIENDDLKKEKEDQSKRIVELESAVDEKNNEIKQLTAQLGDHEIVSKDVNDSDSAKAVPSGNTISSNVVVGDIVSFGHYEQDYNTLNGPEDIEWIVLDVKDGKCLLISKYGLDNLPYNRKLVSVVWNQCSLREWLNSEFLQTSFTAEERSAILLTNIDNSSAQKRSTYNTLGGSDTQDQVFLLSYHEAFEMYFLSDEVRRCAPTDTAIMNNAFSSDLDQIDGRNAGSWWLRSPGSTQHEACLVKSSGYCGSDTIVLDRIVRPAIWVDLNVFQPKEDISEVSKGQSVRAERHPIIKDEADLLTESEEKSLEKELLPLCEYYTPVFWTTDAKDSRSTLAKSKELVGKIADSQECIVFTIDMYTRKIAIYSTTSPYEILTSEEADRIMEDVYLFASGREYYQCAEQAFEEILQLFEKTKQ